MNTICIILHLVLYVTQTNRATLCTTGLQPTARGSISNIRMYCKNCTIIYAARYTTYCVLLFLHVRPLNQPAVKGLDIHGLQENVPNC